MPSAGRTVRWGRLALTQPPTLLLHANKPIEMSLLRVRRPRPRWRALVLPTATKAPLAGSGVSRSHRTTFASRRGPSRRHSRGSIRQVDELCWQLTQNSGSGEQAVPG